MDSGSAIPTISSPRGITVGCSSRLIGSGSLSYNVPHGASGRNVLLNAFVGFSSSDSLDTLLPRCEIPKQFDLQSIGKHGNDYYVWEAVQEYRPQLVIIEYNPTCRIRRYSCRKRTLEEGREQVQRRM